MGGASSGCDIADSIFLMSWADFMFGVTSARTCWARDSSSPDVIACRFTGRAGPGGGGAAGLWTLEYPLGGIPATQTQDIAAAFRHTRFKAPRARCARHCGSTRTSRTSRNSSRAKTELKSGADKVGPPTDLNSEKSSNRGGGLVNKGEIYMELV